MSTLFPSINSLVTTSMLITLTCLAVDLTCRVRRSTDQALDELKQLRQEAAHAQQSSDRHWAELIRVLRMTMPARNDTSREDDRHGPPVIRAREETLPAP